MTKLFLISYLFACLTLISNVPLVRANTLDNAIQISVNGSMPNLLAKCQLNINDNQTLVNKTIIECFNTNERLLIKKVAIRNSNKCNKVLLPSLTISQICNNESKCEISIDEDFDGMCDDCTTNKVLIIDYICTESSQKEKRSKRSYTAKTKDLINRASRELANNLARMPLRFHYDAFYDPLYYEEEYLSPYYYYIDPSRSYY